jgi:hypothetical protein
MRPSQSPRPRPTPSSPHPCSCRRPPSSRVPTAIVDHLPCVSCSDGAHLG